MKVKILNALKTKFDGVSENVLAKEADKLAKTITSEDQVETAVDGVTFQSILESYGDRRANEAQATAIKNYEGKHGIKDGKPIEKPSEENPKEDVPLWAKSLIESNKSLQAEIATMKSEKVAITRKARLNEQLGKLPESFRKGYSRMNVDGLTDEEFESTLNDVKNEIDTIVKETNAKSSIFGTPMANPQAGTSLGAEATDDEAQAVVDRMNF